MENVTEQHKKGFSKNEEKRDEVDKNQLRKGQNVSLNKKELVI